MKHGWLTVVVVLAAYLSSCSAPSAPTSLGNVTLTVSAGANLTAVFQEIGSVFTEQTGIGVTFNFGSTSNLARQIEQGAPVDVFAAANEAYITQLNDAGLVIPDTIARYAIGRLILWTRADSPFTLTSIEDLTQPGITRIAIANPETAPYGVAAREALQTAGLWETLQPKLIFGENIAQTFQYAETGNVDVAFVALSQGIEASDAGKWLLLPDDLHSPLNQVLAVVRSTQHEAEARQFAAFVNSPTGREIMRRYGYILPGEELVTQQ
jgi:molybdate transport system substrate-binding protein